jgi:hypothetical protein
VDQALVGGGATPVPHSWPGLIGSLHENAAWPPTRPPLRPQGPQSLTARPGAEARPVNKRLSRKRAEPSRAKPVKPLRDQERKRGLSGDCGRSPKLAHLPPHASEHPAGHRTHRGRGGRGSSASLCIEVCAGGGHARHSVTNPHFTGIIPVVGDQSDWNFFNSKPPRGGGSILLACCASKALLLTRKLGQQLRDSLTGLRQAALRQFVCESG